jgi:hypothetical protein
LVLKVDNDLGVTKIDWLLYITGTSISPDTTKLSIIGNLEKYSQQVLYKTLTSMIVIDLR